MSFIPPVVDPAQPPIKKRKNIKTFEEPTHSPKSEFTKPVVVTSEIDVKIEFLIDSELKIEELRINNKETANIRI